MTRYEITLDPNYVKDWGVWESVRELRQNTLDQEILNKNNQSLYFFIHNNESKTYTMEIVSTDSELTPQTMLLGYSTKSDDETTIGQFGEGYKLACLVLCRMGFKIEILNYKCKEIWVPKIIKSRRFNGPLLVFDVKKHIFSKVPDGNLTFKIYGLSEEQVDEISHKDLGIYKTRLGHINLIKTEYGEILLDEQFKSKIYDKGLFISEIKNNSLKYGYSLIPELVQIGRDRNLITEFDIYWATGILWAAPEVRNKVSEMVRSGFSDAKYVTKKNKSEEIVNLVYTDFIEEHGKNTYPITSQYDSDMVKTTYPNLKQVIVPNQVSEMVHDSSNFQEMLLETHRETISKKTPYDVLKTFYDLYSRELSDVGYKEFESIVEDSKNWCIQD